MPSVERSHSERYVVPLTTLSVISCISFVHSSPNLFFSSHPFFFYDETWLLRKKTPDICGINFYIKSNVGIMGGDRDRENQ